MARLVALPGRARGGGDPVPARWINPEHIVSVRPRMAGGPPQVELLIELKLEGMPLFETWLGSFSTLDAADQRWQAFLQELTA